MRNILPLPASVRVEERIDIAKNWDAKTTKPSHFVSELLGVEDTSYEAVTAGFEHVIKLPLPPPNERHIQQNFNYFRGPNPISKENRGIADPVNMPRPACMPLHKKIENKNRNTDKEPQIFRIENSSASELDIYVQTPFAVRNQTIGPFAVWSKDLLSTSSKKDSKDTSKQLTSNNDPKSNYFYILAAPTKQLIVTTTGKQEIRDFVFDTGPIGLQVEFAPNACGKHVLCCTRVVPGSQADPFADNFNGAEIIAINGQRVTTLIEFQTAVSIAKQQIGRVVIKALVYKNAKGKEDLELLHKFKNNSSIKEMFSGIGMGFGSMGGGAKAVPKTAVIAEDETESDSDEDAESDNEADAGVKPPAAEEDVDSDAEDDILTRRHRQHRLEASKLKNALEFGAARTRLNTGFLVDEPANAEEVNVEPSKVSTVGKKSTAIFMDDDSIADSTVATNVEEDKDFDVGLDVGMDGGVESISYAKIDGLDSSAVVTRENPESSLVEDEEDGALLAKAPKKSIDPYTVSTDIGTGVELEDSESVKAEPEPENDPEPENPPEIVKEVPSNTFLTGTDSEVKEFTDVTPYQVMVCAPSPVATVPSTWSEPKHYCQFQNFSAYSQASIYWVDEDSTLVLRKVLKPYEDLYIDMIHPAHTWIIAVKAMAPSKLTALKNKLRESLSEGNQTALGGTGTLAGAVAGTGTSAGGEKDEPEELEDHEEEGVEMDPSSKMCIVYKPSIEILNNRNKSLSLVWVPGESITVSQRLRATSSLYRVPSHFNRSNPLFLRNKPINETRTDLSVEATNYANPNVTIQIFDSKKNISDSIKLQSSDDLVPRKRSAKGNRSRTSSKKN